MSSLALRVHRGPATAPWRTIGPPGAIQEMEHEMCLCFHALSLEDCCAGGAGLYTRLIGQSCRHHRHPPWALKKETVHHVRRSDTKCLFSSLWHASNVE